MKFKTQNLVLILLLIASSIFASDKNKSSSTKEENTVKVEKSSSSKESESKAKSSNSNAQKIVFSVNNCDESTAEKSANDELATAIKNNMLSVSSIQGYIDYLGNMIKVEEEQIKQFQFPIAQKIANLISEYLNENQNINLKEELNSKFTRDKAISSAEARIEAFQAIIEDNPAKLRQLNIQMLYNLRLNRKLALLKLAKESLELTINILNKGAATKEKNIKVFRDKLHEAAVFLDNLQNNRPIISDNGKYLVSANSSDSNLVYTLNNFFTNRDKNLNFNRNCQSYLDIYQLGDQFLRANKNSKILQLNVTKQNQMTGGSTSCGYQSILNGIVIARLLLSDSNQRALLLSDLTNDQLRINLFGTQHSFWRSTIINDRKKIKIKEFIYKVLKSKFYVDEDTKKQATMIIADLINNLNLNQNTINIDGAVIKQRLINTRITSLNNRIKNILDNYAGLKPKPIKQLILGFLGNLIDVDIILQTIMLSGIENLNYQIVSSGVKELSSSQATNQENWKNYISGSTRASALPGEWLYGEDVAQIVALEKREGTLLKSKELEHVKFTRIGDMAMATPNRISLQQQAEVFNADLADVIKLVRDPKASGIYVILVCVPGHWITCVVNKTRVNTEAQYIITDSMNNNYLDDSEIIDLIRFLEGKNIPEYPVRQNTGSSCVIS